MINRLGATCSVLVCGFALLVACGSDKPPGFITPDGDAGSSATGNRAGGSNGRAGSGGANTAGTSGGGDAGASEHGSLAPSVEITTPQAVTDPNSNGVLTDTQVLVTCRATASRESDAKKVLSSSVKIQMFDADGDQIGDDGTVRATQNADEYTASFVVTDVANGPVSFKCSATDESSPPNLGSDALSTFVDHGPSVTLKTPEPNSAYPISPAILFQFSANDAPLSPKDKKAEVTDITLSVNGVSFGDVTSKAVPGAPGDYQLTINLADPSVFTPPPTGAVPVRIIATNKRGVARMADFSFNVDNSGPVIQITSPPTPNQFIGGKVTLAFTVVDVPAGVAEETVTVSLNGKPFAYSKDDKNWTYKSATGNGFTYTFDTKNFESQITLDVSIRADDQAGNASIGASIQYYIDNVPPIVDMSPPQLQERQKPSVAPATCSVPFFPLGASPRDLDIVPAVNLFRALLWDIGNSADGQNAFYFSDIDNTNNNAPHLYIQTDTSKPLLKNADPTKHGETCNAIADETLPFIALVPLTPAGQAYYPASVVPQADCVAGVDQQPPLNLCNGNSELTRVVQRAYGLPTPAVPAVYVKPPDALQCTGSESDLTNFATKDGWVCAAVSAIDRTGNRAVSAPLRLCLDAAKYANSPPCAVSSVTPPSCVDDCVPPPHFAPGIITKP